MKFLFYYLVWTVALYLKHYIIPMTTPRISANFGLFEEIFDHFLAYNGRNLSQQLELKIFHINAVFRLARQQEVQRCQTVRSRWPTRQDEKSFSCYKAMFARGVSTCGMWHHHTIITLPNDSDSLAVRSKIQPNLRSKEPIRQ